MHSPSEHFFSNCRHSPAENKPHVERASHQRIMQVFISVGYGAQKEREQGYTTTHTHDYHACTLRMMFTSGVDQVRPKSSYWIYSH